jgi:hypothetical protein
MPANQNTLLSVNWDQVTAFRLMRHHLAERTPKESLLSVVNDMAGAQAQIYSAACTSIWSRVGAIQGVDIDQALHERALVRAACMRHTLFLVPSDHLAIYARGTAHTAEREFQWARRKGVPEGVLFAAIEAALGALDRPLTRPEIAERVSRTLGVQMQSIPGGGWGSRRRVAAVPVGELTYPVVDLLHLASSREVICYGPTQGNEPTFVRARAWIPNWQEIPMEQAESMLLRRYLHAYGPAIPADFALWSGFSLKRANEVWAREEDDLAGVNVGGWEAAILREDLEKLEHAGYHRPLVRLLPYFDTYLLGHRERKHLVPEKFLPEVYRPQGWIAPAILVDGCVRATWKHVQKGNLLQINVVPFEPLSPNIMAGIREEGDNLGRFLGVMDVEIQID